MKTINLVAVVAFSLFSFSCWADVDADREALLALDQSYAKEWMNGTEDSVMALFTEDATLVPHHGDAPVVGKEAIRMFWFNPDYPPTTVPEWDRVAAEVIVSGDMGVVRGRARLTWEYDGTRTTIPEGNYVMIAQRDGGAWRIRLLTWNDDPRKWLQEPIGEDQAENEFRFPAPASGGRRLRSTASN